ncbi:helix-turn-helix transcriptional regulator [Clostridium sp. Marseille-P2415]|uniref:helix-turn-helix transcriptional regulator n=1 Tax=Clostridium sp. Marseille-P2415 TaxID=1805471 RepID=UPI00098885D8|nr:helix-turn-helix transcriptional regulator [Clostridium sp. Marseille-P2415]
MDSKLELLIQIAQGVAAHFGNNCEVVIHDLRKEDIESSIVFIENGQVSNRKLGDGPSEIVLETLKKNPDLLKDRLSYLTRTDDGRILKSSTMYIRGKDNTVDYILALNYDITGLLTIDNALKSLLTTAETAGGDKQPKKITHNVNDLLDTLIEQSVALVGKPVALMSKDDKVTAIQYLNDAGAFLITKSGDKVSNYFGISKFTLYSYMDANKEKA